MVFGPPQAENFGVEFWVFDDFSDFDFLLVNADPPPPWGGGVSGENYGLKVFTPKKYGLKAYVPIVLCGKLSLSSYIVKNSFCVFPVEGGELFVRT